MAAGELIGATAAGAKPPSVHPVTAITTVQLIAATGFATLPLAPHTFPIAVGFLLVSLFSAPMTVWAQSLRMARIPVHPRGRGFAVLRTLMQATPPLGAAIATPLLTADAPLTPPSP